MCVRALTGLALLLFPIILESQVAPTLRLGVDSFHVAAHYISHSQQISIERVGEGYRYVAAGAFRDLMAITVTVDLTEDFAITGVRSSEYAIFGGNVAADVRYEGGRARGTAIRAATGDTLRRIDAAMPPHAIDWLGLLPDLLASSWEPGTSRDHPLPPRRCGDHRACVDRDGSRDHHRPCRHLRDAPW